MSFTDDSAPFSAFPSVGAPVTAEDQLNAAIAGTLADRLPPAEGAGRVQFGRSWDLLGAPDNPNPLPTEGIGTFRVWCEGVTRSARYAHRVFSDAFGMLEPEAMIGDSTVAEAAADYERELRRGILVHDRADALENFVLVHDPLEGTVTFDFDVITDEEERIEFRDLTIPIPET